MPNFKPNYEMSLALVWLNLPNLLWHFSEWDTLCRIFSPIGIPYIIDKATTTITRPTTFKLRIEVDLAKHLIYAINVEVRNQNGKIEVL